MAPAEEWDSMMVSELGARQEDAPSCLRCFLYSQWEQMVIPAGSDESAPGSEATLAWALSHPQELRVLHLSAHVFNGPYNRCNGTWYTELLLVARSFLTYTESRDSRTHQRAKSCYLPKQTVGFSGYRVAQELNTPELWLRTPAWSDVRLPTWATPLDFVCCLSPAPAKRGCDP